ncbi:hypothetical protein [Taklimakanibacter albus]|nr:hypothetical protein [Aestuariivirga sp. YIM B02566]
MVQPIMTDTPQKPLNPYAILALAIALPGSGHVFSGVPARGLQFLFFMIIIGWATSKVAPDQASFIGRYAGGFFIYALSIIDAYKIARVKWETWRYAVQEKDKGDTEPR